MHLTTNYPTRPCSAATTIGSQEAADRLGLTIGQLMPLVHCHSVPHARTEGGHWRFSEADLRIIATALAEGVITVGARKPRRSAHARERAREARERFLKRTDPSQGPIWVKVDPALAGDLRLLQSTYAMDLNALVHKLITIAAAPLKTAIDSNQKSE